MLKNISFFQKRTYNPVFRTGCILSLNLIIGMTMKVVLDLDLEADLIRMKNPLNLDEPDP